MAQTRRDFLRNTACALGGAALASAVADFGLVNAYAQAATDYRALVCVFLNGGNDGNNMIVPLDGEYNQYSAVRGPSTLAVPQASLVGVNPPGFGRPFGLHPSLAPEFANPSVQFKGLLDVWSQGRLAVLCNTGPLVEPLTRTTYQNGTGKKPLQLFSHSDQVNLWQTSVADSVSQTGWAGRMADLMGVLNGASTFPQAVSVAGINLILTGAETRQLAIADARTQLTQVLVLNNAPGAAGYTAAQSSARRAAFDSLRTFDNDAKLVRAASDIRTSSLQTSQALATNPTISTLFPNSANNTTGLTGLGAQLLQVAKIIALRDTLGVKRQVFFCQLGGFDTHANQRLNGGGQDGLLLQVSQAMRAFYDATVELGVSDKVTTFTLSDFGRTFQPAGTGGAVGSDHAWGNHQLIMGGAVRGGEFYGTFPTLALGGPNDTDGGSAPRGRWIPTTSVEQYAATLAAWYGLSSSDFPAVFPLLSRFSTPNLGFMF